MTDATERSYMAPDPDDPADGDDEQSDTPTFEGQIMFKGNFRSSSTDE